MDKIRQGCTTASMGCLECKKMLLNNLETLLVPIKERRARWENDPAALEEILQEGNRRAAKTAEATMNEVFDAMKFR